MNDVSKVYGGLPAVMGSAEAAREFAELWVERHGGDWSIRYRLTVHALYRVIPLRHPPAGDLRLATSVDVAIAAAWGAEFVADTGIRDGPQEFTARLLEPGRLFFWDDAGVKSMVASTRATPNGACINAVYTPAEFRGRGYASAAVAALSRRFLDAGYQFCCLYTDRANPVSNSIYKALGYEPVCDSLEIDLHGDH